MNQTAKDVLWRWFDAVRDERWFRLYGNGLCWSALLVAKYVAGFTWRQVLIGVVAFAVWHLGAELRRHSERTRRFRRVQFTISLDLPQALLDAGIYREEELESNKAAAWESLQPPSRGNITFTWLQQDLFFHDTFSSFSESAELAIDLKPFGRRAEELRGKVPDCIELSHGKNAYELVLMKSEQREAWGPFGRHPMVLVAIPYDFLHSLQSYSPNFERFERQREMLERAGLTYREPGERWWSYRDTSYRGKYTLFTWRSF
jgi:hypothetical protein